MIVADNGSSGYITGAPSPSWNDDALHALQLVPGTALEVVDTTTLTTTLTATPPARLWNTSVRIARGRALARGFLTADSLVALEAARRGVVIRRVLVRCRQGLVSVSLHAVAGARYRLTVR